MPPEPQLWLLVGGNGSGKSTFYDRFLARYDIPLINADNIARSLWPEAPEAHSYDAARLAEKERYRLLDQGLTFCFETVFSHPSKLDFVAQAKARGYRIRIFCFHLDDLTLNLARVACRVEGGGHDVPEGKVRERVPRTLDLVARAVGLADEMHLVDNASADRPYRRVATWEEGTWHLYVDEAPAWVRALMIT